MYNFDYLSVGAIAIGAGERGTVGTPIDAVRRKADRIAQRYRRADAQVKPTAIQVKKNGSIFLLICHQSFVLLLNYSVIKEEGEEEETEDDEDEEGEEDDDADNDGEEENKTKRSNPEVKGAVERPTDVKPEATNRNKRAEEVGYSLLKDGQDVTEEEPEAAASSSSCSSDLSFGASSSGMDHNIMKACLINDLLIETRKEEVSSTL